MSETTLCELTQITLAEESYSLVNYSVKYSAENESHA
jgi:hypothetical protein